MVHHASRLGKPASTHRVNSVADSAPWHWRRGKYYYSKVRRNGRPSSVYVGTGPVAKLAAEQNTRRRAEREAAANHRRQLLTALDNVSSLTAGSARLAELLKQAALLAAGLHHHRGEWRRRIGHATEARP